MKKLSLVLVLSLFVSMVSYGEDLWRRGIGSSVIWPVSSVSWVGIGTGDPRNKLDVRGTIQMTGFKLTTSPHSGYVLTSNSSGVGTWKPASGGGSCYWSKSGSRVYYNSGNVGIGTSSPSAKLGIANLGASNGVSILAISENTTTLDEFVFKGDFAGTGETGNLLKLETHWSNNAMTWRGDGNVGIGTTSPDEKLDINGNLKISGNNKITSGGTLTVEGNPNGYQAATLKLDGNMNAYLYGGDNPGGARNVILAHTGSATQGYVGIRKTNPSYPLDVNGIIQMNGFKLPAGASNNYVLTSDGNGVGTWQAPTGGGTSYWEGDIDGNIYNDNSGKVGIGVTNPDSKLHVQWSAAGPTQEEKRSAIYGYNTSTDASYANSIGVYGRVRTSKGMGIYGYSENSNGYAGYFKGALGITEDGYHDIWRIYEDSNDDLLFRFSTDGGSSWNDILKILDNGNVGIGATNPGKKLDVDGDIRIPYDNRMYFGSASIQGYEDGYGGLKFYGTGGGGPGNLAITVHPSGSVGIGTDQVLSELTVNGTITAEEIEVQVEILPDFVFEDNYKLMPLNKLEKHIKKEKSLPGIPTSNEAVKEGVKLGDMQAKLLQKVEELTLYVIGQDKELIEQNEELKELKKEVGDLRKENRELQQEISSLSN